MESSIQLGVISIIYFITLIYFERKLDQYTEQQRKLYQSYEDKITEIFLKSKGQIK